jgi:hypothetical protein
MTYTDAEICNLALAKLGATFSIQNLQAPQKENERWFALNYRHYKKVELSGSGRKWRFAVLSIDVNQLAGESNNPELPFRYQLPNDCLMPLRDRVDEWQIYGTEIWRALSGTLKLEYISNVPEANFNVEFTEVLVCKLALEACEKITQSNTKRDAAMQAYRLALDNAARANAFSIGFEEVQSDQTQSSWLSSRQGEF